jgi:nicotinamidase/pyrazinamidase
VEHLGQEDLSKLVLISDCMSPVQGFEVQQEAFLESMRAKGLRVVQSADALNELLANAR